MMCEQLETSRMWDTPKNPYHRETVDVRVMQKHKKPKFIARGGCMKLHEF